MLPVYQNRVGTALKLLNSVGPAARIIHIDEKICCLTEKIKYKSMPPLKVSVCEEALSILLFYSLYTTRIARDLN